MAELSALNVRPGFAVADALNERLVNPVPGSEALASQGRLQDIPHDLLGQLGLGIRRALKATRFFEAGLVGMEVVLTSRYPLKVTGLVVQLVPILVMGALPLGWLAVKSQGHEAVNIERARPVADDGVSHGADDGGLHAAPPSHKASVRDLQIGESWDGSPCWG